jgi:DNA polymerase-3 subunit chi
VAAEGACEVWFYHLERGSLDQVLPELLEKTLARGWRALVRVTGEERLDHLDAWLWAYADDSFLAHGLARDPQAERQPILLTLDEANTNGAHALFLVDDAPCGDLTGFSRCVLIFDGRDEAALAAARRRWSEFKRAGHEVAYWRQGETRGWERQA